MIKVDDDNKTDDLFGSEENSLQIQNERPVFRTNRTVFLDNDEKEYILRARFVSF